MTDLPWTKREIVDAMKAGYRPVNVEDPSTYAGIQVMGAFGRLAFGRPKGRAAPYIEQVLWARLRRVFEALCDGRDPDEAYEIPERLKNVLGELG